MNTKEIINLKKPQASDTDDAANVNFVNTAVTNNNTTITAAYKKYSDDQN